MMADRTPQEIDLGTFGILLLGDFQGIGSGAPAEGLAALGERVPVQVDRDDLNRVLASFAPSVHLPGDEVGPPVGIDLRSLEDFEPDRLLERVPLLQTLRDERESVGVRDVRSASRPVAPTQDPKEAASGMGNGSLLDEILDSSPSVEGGNGRSRPAGSRSGGGPLAEFIRRAVEPHRVAPEDPAVEEARRAFDRETVRQLRRILHHPRFQRLEALWRGLDLLVRGLETGPDLKVFVLQCGRDELARGGSGALGALLDRTSKTAFDGHPWSLTVLLDAIGSADDDLELLAAMVAAAGVGGRECLAEVDVSFLDVLDPGAPPELIEKLEGVRRSAGASTVSLLLPRVLLRVPWSKAENPCESIDFDEFAPGRELEPSRLLWGHPGFVGALARGRAARPARSGGGVRMPNRIEGLPIGIHAGPEGTEALPHTEIMLDESAAGELAALGLSPLLSRRGEGWVAIAPFQGIAAAR